MFGLDDLLAFAAGFIVMYLLNRGSNDADDDTSE